MKAGCDSLAAAAVATRPDVTRALEQEVVKGELKHVELDALKGNQGVHNYNLPATVDLNQYQAVAIFAGVFTRYSEWRGWRSFSSADSSGTDAIDGPESCVSY